MTRTLLGPPRQPRLALREIAGNLAYTAGDVTAWYVIPERRWSYLDDDDRETVLRQVTAAYAGLAGHHVHLRVTTRPIPVAVWANNLDALTPNPLPTVPGQPTWLDRIADDQRAMIDRTMAQKEVYLGVVLKRRGNALARTGSRSSDRELRDLRTRLAVIETAVTGPGLKAVRATTRQLEWLMHRSVGLGAPAPTVLSPQEDGTWDLYDLAAFTDRVQVTHNPFSLTSEVRLLGAADSAARHVAVLALGRTPDAMPIPAGGGWMTLADRLGFTVDWSSRVALYPGEATRSIVNRWLLLARGQQRHYDDHGLDAPDSLERNASAALALASAIDGQPSESVRAWGYHQVAVAGRDADECLDRVRALQDLFRTTMQQTLVHPRDQAARLRSFIPGEPAGPTTYIRRLPVGWFGAALPQAAVGVGDDRGSYLGDTCATSRRPVMLDLNHSPSVLERSGLIVLVGDLGSGKSALLGAMAAHHAERGVKTTILDPSGPLARLCDVPYLRPYSLHVDLMRSPAGTLNPYAMVPDPRPAQFLDDPDVTAIADPGRRQAAARTAYEAAFKAAISERRELTLDIVRMLLPPQVVTSPMITAETERAIGMAVNRVRPAPTSTLWHIVAALKAMETEGDTHAGVVASFLISAADMPGASLFFPDRNASALPPMDLNAAKLLVVTMAGITLPDRNTDPAQWTQAERVAVPLLHLGTRFAYRRVYGGPRLDPKVLAMDETRQMNAWASGRALLRRATTDSRKWNLGAVIASQNPEDIIGNSDADQGLGIVNLTAGAWVGRLRDRATAARSLRLLGITPGVGYEDTVLGLSATTPGEFLVRDAHGRVDMVRVRLDHRPELLAALRSGVTGAALPAARPNREIA